MVSLTSGPLYLGAKDSCTNRIEGSLGPRACVDFLEMAYLFSLPEYEPRLLQPVTQ